MTTVDRNVAVVGASANPERYSHRAIKMLLDAGFAVIPVHPALETVLGIPCVRSVRDVSAPVDTVTLYVRPERVEAMRADILGLRPRRIIMNPGAESSSLEESAIDQGIEVVRGCTLVMLRTGQF